MLSVYSCCVRALSTVHRLPVFGHGTASAFRRSISPAADADIGAGEVLLEANGAALVKREDYAHAVEHSRARGLPSVRLRWCHCSESKCEQIAGEMDFVTLVDENGRSKSLY